MSSAGTAAPDLAAIADKLAIQELIATYAVHLDAGAWDDLATLFTPDAQIDYTAMGGPAGDVPSVMEFLAQTLPGFERTQHMMGIPLITLSGDTATARTSCNNPMIAAPRDGKTAVWLFGLWYNDELARTPEGWRFTKRVEERSYTVLGHHDQPLS